jgi:hypothetical protein
MSVIVLGPNPLLRIGHRTIIMGRIRSRPQQLLLRPGINLKVGLPTQSERSALPVKPSHTCQSCIYRRLAPHFITQLTPRSSLGWPRTLIQSYVGIGLIQVISRHSFTRMCVSSLLLLSKVINLPGDWKETLSRCVWITTTVKLTLISSLQVLDAPVCTGLFYSNCLCLSSGVNYWFRQGLGVISRRTVWLTVVSFSKLFFCPVVVNRW